MIRFFILLIVVLGASFGVHYWLLVNNGFDPASLLLIRSYVANATLTIAGFFVLLFFQKRMGGNLIYIFFAFSFVKVSVFVLSFRPVYLSDEELSRLEFFTFFIPYILALVVEIVALSRILKAQDKARNKIP